MGIGITCEIRLSAISSTAVSSEKFAELKSRTELDQSNRSLSLLFTETQLDSYQGGCN